MTSSARQFTPGRPEPARRGHFTASLGVLLLLLATPAAGGSGAQTADLKRLTIEELMRIDVTLATRRESPVGTAATAMSVITADDIRRAGVTTLADALWLADGLHVARVNTGTWAISARGFNATSANKLLVMIDGRTMYSPLFTGVFWNTVDYVLEDIERIEVIRGPGAALWGANAFNGVINIVTRSARDTRGTFASVSGGPQDRGLVEVRHGADSGVGAWRVYGKYADRASQRLTTGVPAGDGRHRGQVGFRIDGGADAASRWMLKGDAFHSRDSFPQRPDGEFTDLALQGRWARGLGTSSRLEVQSYYRREYRRVPDQLTHAIDTFDVDAQHTFTAGARHAVVWGAGVRVNADRSYAGQAIGFDPARRTYALGSVFAQDDIAVRPDRLYLTLGAKFEHNSFSGGDLQPSLRVRLLPSPRQIVWGALSHAVRRPTRLDTDVEVRDTTGALLIRGSDEFQSESLVAWEAGYRIQPRPSLSIDANVFRHDISRLRSQDLPPGSASIVIGNSLQGLAYGVEIAAHLQPSPRWRTQAGYTRLVAAITRQPGSLHVGGTSGEGNDPGHIFRLVSAIDLTRTVELQAMVRAVSALPDPVVPAYAELTLRAGWFIRPRVELWGTGEDLLHGRHAEFGPAGSARVEFARAVRAGVAFRY
jgi:iron complex outermembrane recepter protein